MFTVGGILSLSNKTKGGGTMKNKKNAIDLFLESWKEKALAFYLDKKTEFEKLTRKEIPAFQRNETKEVQAMMLESAAGIAEKLDKEVARKKANLIARIEKKAGKIKNASDLSIGSNGEINGEVVGEIKTVKVQTIYAGGENIQCLHYRVLVK